MLAGFCVIAFLAALCKSAMIGGSEFIWEGVKMLGGASPVQ